MFRITTQQKDSFQRALTRQFHQDIVDFFEKEEPALFKTLSAPQKLAFVEACHERAQLYGLKLAASIYAWVDVSILIGSSFHQDIFFKEFTTELKKAATAFDERDCMERVQKRLSAYLLAVRGKKNEHAIKALQRIRAYYEQEQRPSAVLTEPGQPLEEYVTALTARLHPELYAYHGGPMVREKCAGLIHRSQSYYGITGEWHLTCMCILGLSFGAGFDFDELYPWIRKTLDKVPQLGPERCVEKLASRSIIWLDHALKNKVGET
jgi:hypothetical protein